MILESLCINYIKTYMLVETLCYCCNSGGGEPVRLFKPEATVECC